MEAMFQLKEVAPQIQDLPTAMPLDWKGCSLALYLHTYRSMYINLLSHFQTGGSITFKDVHFSYPSNPDRKILNGLSLHVPAGKKVAIVGSSGSGKSTIYRLLYRFYDADSGQVLVDQQDVRNITLPSLRSVRAAHIKLPYGAYFMLIISLVLFGFTSL